MAQQKQGSSLGIGADLVYRMRIRKVDLAPSKRELGDKVKRGEAYLVPQVGKDSNNYVPLKDGQLRASMTPDVSKKQVTWESRSSRGYPYGVRQYENQFSNYTTANTGPYWDKKAAGIHMSAWIKGTEGAMR